MMQLIKSAAIIGAVSVLAWGCATIMHGTTQRIGVSSSPSGAKVWVDNKEHGITPLFAELKRGDEHIVKIELEGYQKAELTITKSVSGWVWGNVLIGGLIGLAIDALSGGLYYLTPEQLNAELKKSGTSALQEDGGLYVVTVLYPDPSWRKIATLEAGE